MCEEYGEGACVCEVGSCCDRDECCRGKRDLRVREEDLFLVNGDGILIGTKGRRVSEEEDGESRW